MITYTLEDEDTTYCEWEHYGMNETGEICVIDATKVILEHDDDRVDQHDETYPYPEPLHIGHLCDEHSELVWPHFAALNEHGGDSKTDIGDTIGH